jgi:hypothetical protein
MLLEGLTAYQKLVEEDLISTLISYGKTAMDAIKDN